VRQHDAELLKPGALVRSQTTTASCCAAAAIACLVALLTLPHRAFATEAGQVLTYNGDCYALVDGKRNKLNMGDVVHVGDVLEIPVDAKLKLQMAEVLRARESEPHYHGDDLFAFASGRKSKSGY